MNKSERMRKLQEELQALEAQPDPILDEDQLGQLLFRMNNIGYSLKRIADSCENLVTLLRKDQE
jgi:uncharacterized protein Yka (UPF0111/DUF47 family)